MARRKKRNHRWRNRLRAAGGAQLKFCASDVQILAACEDDKDKRPRFAMIAYTGGAMQPMGFTDSVIVDISGIEIPSQFPVHRDHDTSKVVGHATARRQQGKLVVQGIASASNEHAREVVDSAKNGFPWQASIGASIKSSPEVVLAGESTEVNGRRVRGPVRVFRKTRLDEVSFVSIGADRNTTTSVAASFTEVKEMTFEQWLKAMGFNIDEMEQAQVTALHGIYDQLQASGDSTEGDGEGETDDAPEADTEAPEAAPAPQTTHQAVASADPAAIAAASYRRIGYVEKHLASHPSLAAKALTENWGEDRCRLEALLATRSTGPGVHATRPLMSSAVLASAVALQHGTASEDSLVGEFNEQTVTAARKHVRDLSLTYLVHEVMRARGEYVHSGARATPEMVARVVAQDMAFDSGITASSSGSSNVTLTGVLSNNANKSLLQGYMEPRAVRNQICAITSHSDFKTNSKYRTSSAEFLAELPPNGQIDHMTMDEEAYTNAVKTYARMLTLTRTMIINDDLGAFLGIASGMGQRASASLERAVFETLLADAGSTFVTAATVAVNGHLPNQVASAAANALSTTSLKAAETLFLRQVDKHGNPIMVEPGVILIPSDLRRIADDLIQFSNVSILPQGQAALDEANAAAQLHVANRWIGRFSVADTPWLSDSAGLTNGDANDWYLVANPTRNFALMEIAFLGGRQTPTVETAPTSFDTLGTSWRVYFDWGIAFMDPRAGVKMIVA